MKAHFILFVSDQKKSTEFYSTVLDMKPTLDVPGMSEFSLGPGCVLGLMPATGASKLLKLELNTSASPGAEVYLIVESAADYHTRALNAGARELSPLAARDWGHVAAYSSDPDGHIIAFAEVR